LARKYDMVISFDWTGEDGEIRSSWEMARNRGAVIAAKEVAASKCDVFILVTPANGRGLGCYVEFGVALGHGAICLVYPLLDRDSVFFCHPLVHVVDEYDGLETALENLKWSAGKHVGMFR